VFCREHVAQLRDDPQLPVVFVTMGNPRQAEAFRASLNSPHRFVCDPDRELYRRFELPRGSFTQMFSLKTFQRGAQATKAGHRVGKPIGDPFQLGGSVVLDGSGEVFWKQVAVDAADNASLELVRQKVVAADRKT
jgi:hypothetical protein